MARHGRIGRINGLLRRPPAAPSPTLPPAATPRPHLLLRAQRRAAASPERPDVGRRAGRRGLHAGHAAQDGKHIGISKPFWPPHAAQARVHKRGACARSPRKLRRAMVQVVGPHPMRETITGKAPHRPTTGPPGHGNGAPTHAPARPPGLHSVATRGRRCGTAHRTRFAPATGLPQKAMSVPVAWSPRASVGERDRWDKPASGPQHARVSGL